MQHVLVYDERTLWSYKCMNDETNLNWFITVVSLKLLFYTFINTYDEYFLRKIYSTQGKNIKILYTQKKFKGRCLDSKKDLPFRFRPHLNNTAFKLRTRNIMLSKLSTGVRWGDHYKYLETDLGSWVNKHTKLADISMN